MNIHTVYTLQLLCQSAAPIAKIIQHTNFRLVRKRFGEMSANKPCTSSDKNPIWLYVHILQRRLMLHVLNLRGSTPKKGYLPRYNADGELTIGQ